MRSEAITTLSLTSVICPSVAFAAIFHLLDHARYALRGFETRDEAQAHLSKFGQKVLTYESTVKKPNFDILYEWGSYALYRNQVFGELSRMGSNAVKAWKRRDEVRIDEERSDRERAFAGHLLPMQMPPLVTIAACCHFRFYF